MLKTIKEWAKDDRLREKLLMKGPSVLSDAELIVILIHHGTKEKSAVQLGREILQLAQNDLVKLSKLSVQDITQIKGIGEAKAVTIAAALELGTRRDVLATKKLIVSSSADVAAFLRHQFKLKKQEIFAVVFLNRSNRINHIEIISEGGITGTIADPRIILKKALDHEAVHLILCHNHPSGNVKPSKADEELTQKIKSAAVYFDIKVVDHIIVSEEGYFSFADEGLL